MNKLIVVVGATIFTGGVAAGAGGILIPTSSEAAASRSAKVSVVDDRFSPKVATVKAKGSVTWTWRGDSPHDLDGKGGIKKATQTNGTYKKKFNRVGSYRYVCTIHDGMTGTVKVVK